MSVGRVPPKDPSEAARALIEEKVRELGQETAQRLRSRDFLSNAPPRPGEAPPQIRSGVDQSGLQYLEFAQMFGESWARARADGEAFGGVEGVHQAFLASVETRESFEALLSPLGAAGALRTPELNQAFRTVIRAGGVSSNPAMTPELREAVRILSEDGTRLAVELRPAYDAAVRGKKPMLTELGVPEGLPRPGERTLLPDYLRELATQHPAVAEELTKMADARDPAGNRFNPDGATASFEEFAKRHPNGALGHWMQQLGEVERGYTVLLLHHDKPWNAL
jgi:hypothetical protein